MLTTRATPGASDAFRTFRHCAYRTCAFLCHAAVASSWRRPSRLPNGRALEKGGTGDSSRRGDTTGHRAYTRAIPSPLPTRSTRRRVEDGGNRLPARLRNGDTQLVRGFWHFLAVFRDPKRTPQCRKLLERVQFGSRIQY